MSSGVCNIIDNYDRPAYALAEMFTSQAGNFKTRTREGYLAQASVGGAHAGWSVF